MRRLLVLLLISRSAFGAIASATQWEIFPTTGSDTNGGAFALGVAVGTVTGTDGVIDASLATKFTSASHGTFASDVGKWLKFTSGTGFTVGFYHIESSSSTAAVLDRAIGTLASTGGNYTLYPGIDRTRQTGAQVTIDNAAITATCNTNTITFTGGTYTPSNADIGNYVQLITATGGTTGAFTPAHYEITNTNASTTWTIAGAATACHTGTSDTLTSAKMGGALATFTNVQAQAIAQNKILVKATGTMSSGAMTFAVNGTAGNTVAPIRITGYTTNPNDGGQVTIQPSSAGLTLFTFSGVNYVFENFIIDGSGANTVGTCIALSGGSNEIRNVKCNNFTGTGFILTATADSVIDSEVSTAASCTNGISYNLSGTEIRGNQVHGLACQGIAGLSGGVSSTISFNLVYNNGANACILFDGATTVTNNTVDGCSIGIVASLASSTAKSVIIRNNLITASTTGLELWTSAGYGFSEYTDGNCYFGNTTNRTNSDDEGISTLANGIYPKRATLDKILGSTPYVDNSHASGNYAITANGGTAYQVGTPGTFLGPTNTGYMSCGAVIPQAVAGGGGASISF